MMVDSSTAQAMGDGLLTVALQHTQRLSSGSEALGAMAAWASMMGDSEASTSVLGLSEGQACSLAAHLCQAQAFKSSLRIQQACLEAVMQWMPWLADDAHVSVILGWQPVSALQSLLQLLGRAKDRESLSRWCISQLSVLILSPSWLSKSLHSIEREGDSAWGRSWTTNVLSMPDIVGNSLRGRDIPESLERTGYYRNLVKAMEEAIMADLCEPGKHTFDTMCELYARICREGCSGQITMSWLHLSRKDPSSASKVAHIIEHLQPQEIQSLWRALLLYCSGDSVSDSTLLSARSLHHASEQLGPLLCHPVAKKEGKTFHVLSRTLVIDAVMPLASLQLLIHSLSTIPHADVLASHVLPRLVQSWTDTVFVHHSSAQQHRHVTCGILLCLNHIPPDRLKTLDCIHAFICGMSPHLQSRDPERRVFGMVTAECFSSASGTFQKLDFELPENSETRFLRQLAGQLEPSSVHEDTVESIDRDLDELRIDGDASDDDLDPGALVIDTDSASVTSAGDSDDDDLRPYPMQHNDARRANLVPLYLRDCLKGLGDEENPDRVQASLEVVSTIILRAHRDDLGEVAIPLAARLLNLQDTYELDNFAEYRMKAMVALLFRLPEDAERYLIEQFEGNQCSLAQKCDILSWLNIAAQSLSKGQWDFAIRESPLVALEASSKNLVQHTKNPKTTVFAPRALHRKGSEPRPMLANRFAPVASGWFDHISNVFVSLRDSIQTRDETFMLLEKLTLTLSLYLQLSANTVHVRSMARRLNDLVASLWPLCTRSRPEQCPPGASTAEVCHAILIAYSVIFGGALPDWTVREEFLVSSLLGAPSWTAQGIMDMLIEIVENQPHEKNIRLAQALLARLESLLRPVQT